jgi:NACalpha-BTF3-like transcription factor
MDLEVIPDNWIMPNRIAYNKYIYNTFNATKYLPKLKSEKGCECDKTTQVCDISSKAISLFPQQRIVRDFIQVNSPYRGILLYHELGSGKSGASIAAAEGYVGKRRVFVLTPASLAQNYENELMKISKLGLNLKKSWTQIKVDTKNAAIMKMLRDTYAITSEIIKKDGLVWIPLYADDIPNVDITIENKTYSSLSGDNRTKIDETIIHIIRNRYTFISYNGLTQKLVNELSKTGFDNSFIIIDEVHNFVSRIVNGSKLARGVYNAIMSAKDSKLVLLSGTPIINNPYEVATLINLIRGPMNIYEFKLLKNSAEPNDKELVDKLIADNLYQYVDEVHFNKNKNNIYISLLPEGYSRTSSKSIEILPSNWSTTISKLIEKLIVSINGIKLVKIGKVPATSSYYALPNNKDEFNKMFIDSSDQDNPAVKNMDLFQRRILGTLSYYRVSGTEYFPQVLPNNIQYLDMTDHQFSAYADVRAKERAMDNAQKRHSTDVMSDKSSVYRAFSRMVCNFAFPEEIKRVFPQDIRKLMKQELGKDDDEYESDEEEIDKDAKKNLKKVKEEYDETLDKAIKHISAGDYLQRTKLLTMYSPKYAKMLEDIDESPGTVLIYSQFRMMEGLGIFAKALDNEGYKEIVIKKTEEGYIFEDPAVFDPIYDGKRYVVFSSDRMKTNILINLFNGAFSLLPESIMQRLPREYINDKTSQLYGKLAKLIMITQSGAEGISLKNVRRVLIMEYFWNSVRINQVIGRAVRACSHEMLPLNERNVQIFTYIMKFTKKQMEKDFTLRTVDNALTTDQHILQLATKKDNIVNQFLNMLKAASFDCITHSVQNKPMQNGYKCYNWAVNAPVSDLAYIENIDDEAKIQKHQKYQVLKRNKGIVVSHNQEKYVMIDKKLYDYFSYKNAGVLIPI